MTRTILSALALGALLVGSPAWAQDNRPADPPTTTVPFEMLKTGHMAIMIKVNGQGPYRVIFDTGAPVNLLSNKVSREAKLAPSKKPGGGPTLPIFGARGLMDVKVLEIGGVTQENVTVMVMDHPALKAASGVLGPLEGIVGFPFFARFRMTMDYEKQTLTLTPVDYEPQDLFTGLMETMMNPRKKPAPKVYAPAAVWGFMADKATDDEAEGVTVTRVLPGSAADAAGLKPGDRLRARLLLPAGQLHG